jgi:hypothetical protein
VMTRSESSKRLMSSFNGTTRLREKEKALGSSPVKI